MTGNNQTKKGNQVTPTSTALQARVILFQPSQKPRAQKGQWVETKYGRCRVTGRLGQRHADLLESMLYVAERRRDSDDGGVELLVDPAQVRKMMSEHHYSHQQIQKLLVELRSATIEIITPEMEQTEDRIIGGLIDHAIPSKMTRPNPLGGERHLLKVRLGLALIMLLDHDLSLYYEPAPIAKLKHGISQAVARHILTHKNEPTGGWRVDTLLRAVCGEDADPRAMRNGRFRIKEDKEGLEALGIELTKDKRIRRLTTAQQ